MMNQPMTVLTSMKTVEWYTPPEFIRIVRSIFDIDLDPASNGTAQQWIKARNFYTAQDDGLSWRWTGNVFLNPPFDQTPKWIKKMQEDYDAGWVAQGIALVNSAPGYNWFEDLWRRVPVCMLRKRLSFVRPDGTANGQAKKGQCVAYWGESCDRFIEVFSPHGLIITNGRCHPAPAAAGTEDR